MKTSKLYRVPEIELLPCAEFLTLIGSGEAQDGDLMGADWNAPDGIS